MLIHAVHPLVELAEGVHLGGHGQLIVEGDHDGVLGLEGGHGGLRGVEEYLPI